jgi:uncharacterized protein (DUF1330 family)
MGAIRKHRLHAAGCDGTRRGQIHFHPIIGKLMRTHYLVALSLAVGAVLGAAAVQALHAQARPLGYVVGEINITDPQHFAKDFSPLARKALAEAPGYRALVLGGKVVPIEGEAPNGRVIINVFDNVDAAEQAYRSPAFKAAKAIGDKYATFHTYAVEGRAN